MAGMRVPIVLEKSDATEQLNEWLAKESQAAQISAKLDLGAIPESLDIKADVELQGVPEELDLKAKADLSDIPADIPVKADVDLSSLPKEVDLKAEVNLDELPKEVPLKVDADLSGLPQELPLKVDADLSNVPTELPLKLDADLSDIPTEVPLKADLDLSGLPSDLPVKVDPDLSSLPTELDLKGNVDLSDLPAEVPLKADVELTGLPSEIDLPGKVDLSGIPESVEIPAALTGLPSEVDVKAQAELIGLPAEVDLPAKLDTSGLPAEVSLPVDLDTSALPPEVSLPATLDTSGLPTELDIPAMVDLSDAPTDIALKADVDLSGIPDEVDVKAVAEFDGAQIPAEVELPVVVDDAGARAQLEQVWQDAEAKFGAGVELPISVPTDRARDALGRFQKGASEGLANAGAEGGAGLAGGIDGGTVSAQQSIEKLDKTFAEKVASMSKRDWGRSIKAIKLAVDTALPALGLLDENAKKSADSILDLGMSGAKLGGAYGAAAGVIAGIAVDAFSQGKASAKALSDEIKKADDAVSKFREETVSLDTMDLSHAVAATKQLTTEQAHLEAALAATRAAREADRQAIGDDDLGPSREAGATLQKYIELLKSQHTSAEITSVAMDELSKRTAAADDSLGDVLGHLESLGKKRSVKELQADFDKAKAKAEEAKGATEELRAVVDSPFGKAFGGGLGEWVRALSGVGPAAEKAGAELKTADSALKGAQDEASAAAAAAFKEEASHAQMLLDGWESVRKARERLTQAAYDQEKALKEQALSDGKAFEETYQSLAKSLSPEIAEEYGQAIVDAFAKGDAAVQQVADDALKAEEIYLRGIGMRAAAEKSYNDLYLELQQQRIGFDEAEAEAQNTILQEQIEEASALATSYAAAMQPLAQVTGAIFDAVAQNVAKGDKALKGIGTTAKAAISDVLKSYARKWGLEALTDVGYGLAALATGPIGGISAGLFFEAAGLLGGAALAAGGAGIAIGKGTSASAGSSSSAGSSGSGGGFSGGPGASPGNQQFATDVQAPMIVNVYGVPFGVITDRELAAIGGRLNAAQAANKGNGGMSFAG